MKGHDQLATHARRGSVAWLREEETPAVRHLALLQLLDQPEDAPEVRQALADAMQNDLIATILAAQQQ